MTFTPEESPTARVSADVLLENLRFEGWTADGVNITSTQTGPLEIKRADGSIEIVEPDSWSTLRTLVCEASALPLS